MTKGRPEKPAFLDHPSARVLARRNQIERLRLKLEGTYRHYLAARSPAVREMLETLIAEYEDRIAHLERLNRAATD